MADDEVDHLAVHVSDSKSGTWKFFIITNEPRWFRGKKEPGMIFVYSRRALLYRREWISTLFL